MYVHITIIIGVAWYESEEQKKPFILILLGSRVFTSLSLVWKTLLWTVQTTVLSVIYIRVSPAYDVFSNYMQVFWVLESEGPCFEHSSDIEMPLLI